MQGDLRSFKYQKKFAFVNVKTFKGKIKQLKIGLLSKNIVEDFLQPNFVFFAWVFLVGFQFIVQIPNLLTDVFKNLLLHRTWYDKLCQSSLRMNPTKRMGEYIKSPGIVTDNYQTLRNLRHHAAEQSSFSCNFHVAGF